MVSLKLHVVSKMDMVLLKCLQRSPLPNPNGPLSYHVPLSSTIAAVNKEITGCQHEVITCGECSGRGYFCLIKIINFNCF